MKCFLRVYFTARGFFKDEDIKFVIPQTIQSFVIIYLFQVSKFSQVHFFQNYSQHDYLDMFMKNCFLPSDNLLKNIKLLFIKISSTHSIFTYYFNILPILIPLLI